MLAERVVEWTKEWKQEGLEQGLELKNKALMETASRMLVNGFAVEVISEMTGLAVEKIESVKPKH